VLGTVAQSAGWPGNPLAVGLASGVGTLGLGILVAGIAGRRSGGLSLFAITGMVAALVATAAPVGLSQPWEAGDRSYEITSMSPAPDVELGVGQLKLDLSGAQYQKTPGTDTVKATVGLGELDIVVPDGASVVVNSKARAGEIIATGAGVAGEGMRRQGPDQLQHQGTGWQQTVTFGSTTAAPDIVVDAQLGVGQIKITTAARAS